MARLAGFEPATLGLEGRCSIQMSYRRMMSKVYAAVQANYYINVESAFNTAAPSTKLVGVERLFGLRPHPFGAAYGIQAALQLVEQPFDFSSGALISLSRTSKISGSPRYLRSLFGRGREIRTPDILLPKQARYQTALYPELLPIHV